MPLSIRCSSVLPLVVAFSLPWSQAWSQSPVRAEARAEARADGSRDSQSSSHSATHRVVVVNGRTVVDERTENGRPGRGGLGGNAGAPARVCPDLADLMRKAAEEAERAFAEECRRDPGGAPRAEEQERMLRDVRGRLRDQLDREMGRDDARRGSSDGPRRGADEADRRREPIPPAGGATRPAGVGRGLEPRSKSR